MTHLLPRSPSLIWATRGQSWGFRFLLDAGLEDPLPEYERAFAGVPDQPTAWHRHTDSGALRFPDPLDRRDSAGRMIPHEFVVFDAEAEAIDSVEQGIQRVWPLVRDFYAGVWDSATVPETGVADLGP